MTKQPARIQVKETKRYWGDFEGSLESIIASLQADLDEGWEGIETDYEQYSAYASSLSDYPSPFLYKHREETDKEYDKRMRAIEKQKAEEVKAKERKLKQLKKDLASLSDTDRKHLGL